MLWVYGQYECLISLSAGTVLIRQNLMSIEARFCVDRSHDMFGTYFAHRVLTTPTDTQVNDHLEGANN